MSKFYDKIERYAPRKCWANPMRMMCEMKEDGFVDFANDITTDELKDMVAVLLRESEYKRQRILRLYCGEKLEEADPSSIGGMGDYGEKTKGKEN